MALSKPTVAIGIDLGTTSSAAGVWRNGKVEIIPNEHGQGSTPSYLAFTSGGGRLVGRAARAQATINPKNVIHGFKTLLGRDFYDPVVQEGMKHCLFEVINIGDRPNIAVEQNGEVNYFTPEELTSMLLTYLKRSAEVYLDQEVTHAVISIPAGFHGFQVAAIKTAAKLAGLEVLRVVSDPNAAAMAYVTGQAGTGGEDGGARNVLFFNVGGGTTGVSVITVDEWLLEVKAVIGDPNLGGDDFTRRFFHHLVQEFKEKFERDLGGDPDALGRLDGECDRVKRMLSSIPRSRVTLYELHEGIHFDTDITQARFEELCVDLFHQAVDVMVSNVLRDAKMTKSDIHEVVLVGGSSRVPKIQQLLQDYFEGKTLNMSLDPLGAPVRGAALHAALLSGSKVAPLLLLDVTPFSLGVETAGGVMATLIQRNATIPTKATLPFTTAYDNQAAVIIAVYEGERNLVKDNKLLGTFSLPKITLAKAGVPQIRVTFDLDANGALVVTAVEMSSREENRLTIDPGDEEKMTRAVLARNLINDLKNNENMMKECRRAYSRLTENLRILRGTSGGAAAAIDPGQLDSESSFNQKVTELEDKAESFKAMMAARGCRLEEGSVENGDFPLVSRGMGDDLGDDDEEDDDGDLNQDQVEGQVNFNDDDGNEDDLDDGAEDDDEEDVELEEDDVDDQEGEDDDDDLLINAPYFM